MTTTLPRPIEPGDIKPGQRVRAEATHLGDLDLYEFTVTSAAEDIIRGRWVMASPDHYTWTLLEDVPEPAREVGSHWLDPETGAEYVRTDDSTPVQYTAFVNRLDANRAGLCAGTPNRDKVIARLVPIPSRAELAEEVAETADRYFDVLSDLVTAPGEVDRRRTAAMDAVKAWRAAQ